MKELTAKYNFQSYLYKNLNTEAYKQNDSNCRRLLHTLECIELIESTLALNLDTNSPERNALILLNMQFIGAAQEKLSREFTARHPTLKDLGFTQTVNKKNKSWFGHDRLAIAYSFDLSFLNDSIDDQNLAEELAKLKEVIIPILAKELNNEEFVTNLIEQKINFDPKITAKRKTNI